MLAWVEKNVFKIRLQLNDTYIIEYYEGDGTHREACGISLRDCIQNANNLNLQGVLYFLHKNIPMMTVASTKGSCVGCDMWVRDCASANNSLEDEHGVRCGTSHQIMFVHSKDKEEYED